MSFPDTMPPTRKLYQEDGYLVECEATITALHEKGVILDQSVFYCQGGGQPGDVGWLVGDNGHTVDVVDTVSDPVSGGQIHVIADIPQGLAVGQRVTARIDWDRRYRLMRMHSCMHMLCAVIDAPVTGGSVSDGRARLDFDMPTPPDRESLNTQLNEMISRDRPMAIRWITDEELESQPELVRTMSVNPPTGQGRVRLIDFDGIDLQPCGGTHVARSGEIRAVRISKIEKKGKQNRRVIVEFD